MALSHGIAGGRDVRIDFFRGVALVMIFINHIPGNPMSLFTQRSWGFSDSAEVFVLLAGIASALAYSRFFDRGAIGAGILAIFSRIWVLYGMHLLLFLVVAAMCILAAERLGDTTYMEALGFDVFLQAPASFIIDTLTLSFLPGYLDILPLYIVLLGSLPVLMLLSRQHWALPLGFSVVLYIAAQLLPLNFANSRTAHVWFFNPAAWQLIFVIGFTIGRRIATRAGFPIPVPARHALSVLAVGVTVTTFMLEAPWRQIPGFENAFLVNPASLSAINKTNFHPVRLMDILAKFWLVATFVSPAARWLQGPAARRVIQMGQHSLEVFSLSIVLSVGGGIIATANGFAPLLVAAINLSGIIAMVALGALLEWRRQANASLAAARQPLAVERGS